MREKICIIGGGNIGTAMASMISRNPNYAVVVHTSKKDAWQTRLQMEDLVSGTVEESGCIQAVSCFETAVSQAKVVLITHPSFMIERTLEEISPFLSSDAWVGIVPGSGGAEYYAQDMIGAGRVFFGLDRVPCVARVKETGKKVALSPKSQVRVAAIPSESVDAVCDKLRDILGIDCVGLKNYLTVTLTPSNPILHTARLYSMFSAGEQYRQPVLFYKEWTDEASELLLACDRELQDICKRFFPLKLEVVPLTVHYESNTVEEMTKKLSSIQSLSRIYAPMRKEKDGYTADLESRYFVEDIPFGLCILKGIAAICGVATPTMDQILKWYERIRDVEYYVDDAFCGKDLKNTAIPQNFGLDTYEKLLAFYEA